MSNWWAIQPHSGIIRYSSIGSISCPRFGIWLHTPDRRPYLLTSYHVAAELPTSCTSTKNISPTNQEGRQRPRTTVKMSQMCAFSNVTFCRFMFDNSSNIWYIDLGSFVSVLVCLQINFLYNWFSKLFSAKPSNLNILNACAVTANLVIND